ncbi:MAG TPA: hypothetical protein VK837_03890 [Longimicrobiales bacterium]|nr:hypothetical protein [Longimicrobiales bacterium]
MIDAFETRPVRPLGLWTTGDWRWKAYHIGLPGGALDADLESAARRRAAEIASRPSRHETYGVGFVGIHQGRGYNQVFVDRWANHNELLHDTFVSEPTAPGGLVPAPDDHNAVCVWDLALQAFERAAWIELAMGPDGDPDAYLGRVLEGRI